MENPTNRVIYIDVIKVFLTCMVVVHHAGQAYGNTGGVWIVSEAQKVDYLRPFFFFNAAYMMGFYFFISGYFMYFSLQRKSTKQFLLERFIKLGIPLTIFSLLIFIPLHYFLSSKKSSYIDFSLDLYFHKPPLAIGHLWFVASLLAYSILYLCLSKIPLNSTKPSTTFRVWYPLVYVAVLIPMNVLVRQYYPIDTWVTWGIPIEVAHLPQYLSLFLLGTFFNKNKWLENIALHIGMSYFMLGLLLFSLKMHLAELLPGLWNESIIESFLCVGLCLGLIVVFKKYFNQMTPVLKIISDNAYGIYLFHLLIVIELQLFFKNYTLDTNLKFVFVSILSIAMSCAVSYMMRKNRLIRTVI